jgi:N-acetylneuraminate synthase
VSSEYEETSRRIFDGLFVLELANNHWGSLDRGLKIVTDFARVVRFNNVKAAIKLQFRDVDRFIHKDFRHRQDIRYIKKTIDTQMTKEEFRTLVNHVVNQGGIPMATPFDEDSVDFMMELGIEKIAKTRKPAIVSTGGSSLKDIDDLVSFFRKRNIPLAINHCVSLYPSDDGDLEINQIDFLRSRYPENVIGFSTHEMTDWASSVMIAYAKGARTFERHIDIEDNGIPVSKYCTLPHQADQWFKAWKKVVEMSGAPGTQKRVPPKREIEYLNGLVRGVYAKRAIARGEKLLPGDVYLAIPLQKGQISCRELMNGEVVLADLEPDQAIMIDHIDSPYAENEDLKKLIYQRGVEEELPVPTLRIKTSRQRNRRSVERPTREAANDRPKLAVR